MTASTKLRSSESRVALRARCAGYAASHIWPQLRQTTAPGGRAGDPWLSDPRLALYRVSRFNERMSETRVDFSAPAELRKWPSLNNERVSAPLGAGPYIIGEGGTLDECVQQFMQLPESQRHLYEIHTVPQSDLVGAILSRDHIVELARLRDFLGS
jgi:hypothetical protein